MTLWICWQLLSLSPIAESPLPLKAWDLQALTLLFILEIQYISWSQNTRRTLLISSSCFVQSHTSNYSTAVCPHVSKSSCSVVAVWMWHRTKRVGVYLLTAGSASMSQPKIQPKTPVNFTFPSDLKQLSTLEIADHYQICWEHMWFCELHTEALSCKNT